MPGKHITDQQVRWYMQSRKDGYGQATAAARAGFSGSTARRIDKNPMQPSQRDRVRRYRTRSDPVADVWQTELVPLLEQVPSLRATSLLKEPQRLHPGRYPDRLLRSVRRRAAHWRATEGLECELISRQEHPPGRQALSNFTDGGGLSISIAGEPFGHLLSTSGWPQRLAIRQGALRRRELHDADRGAAGSAVAIGRRAQGASYRPTVAG
jgi:hypothetical protein